MTNDDDTDKSGFEVHERRNRARRADKDRRDRMRWDLENPIRRKSPGAALSIEYFTCWIPNDKQQPAFARALIGMSGVAAAKSTHTRLTQSKK
jgi:hypothetical protein